jgi:hypothetical protein
MMPPVGKSGPGMISISSSKLIAGLSIIAIAGIDHFAQIVRRNVGRHADGNAACSVDQQVGKPAGSTVGSVSDPS